MATIGSEAVGRGNLEAATGVVGLEAVGEERVPSRAIRELATDILKHPDEWLDHPNPQFGGRKPNDVIAAGDGDKVYNMPRCFEFGLF